MTSQADGDRQTAALPPRPGQTALVTGASSGIGKTTTPALRRASADVVVTYIAWREEAQEVVKQVQAFSARVHAHEADVPDQVQAVDMVGEFGTIDIVAAGTPPSNMHGTCCRSTRRWRCCGKP